MYKAVLSRTLYAAQNDHTNVLYRKCRPTPLSEFAIASPEWMHKNSGITAVHIAIVKISSEMMCLEAVARIFFGFYNVSTNRISSWRYAKMPSISLRF